MILKLNQQKGASAILITFMILSIVLVIGLGFSYITNLEIKNTREATASIKAYQLADTSLELAIEFANSWPQQTGYLTSAPDSGYICGSGCDIGDNCFSLGDGQFCMIFLDSSGNPVDFTKPFGNVHTIKAIGKVGSARRSTAVNIR